MESRKWMKMIQPSIPAGALETTHIKMAMEMTYAN